MPTVTVQQLQAESTSAPLEVYAGRFPELLAETLKGFRSREHRAILAFLDSHGRQSFNQLQKGLEMRSNLLAKKLKELERAGLVANYLARQEGSSEYSWYELTGLANLLLKNLIETYSEYLKPPGKG